MFEIPPNSVGRDEVTHDLRNGILKDASRNAVKLITAQAVLKIIDMLDPDLDAAGLSTILDENAGVVIELTLASNPQTLQPPSDLSEKKRFLYSNLLTSVDSIDINNVPLLPGFYREYLWNGEEWSIGEFGVLEIELPENTKFVSPSYSDTDPFFSTIQGAINSSSVVESTLILVYPGIYDEKLSNISDTVDFHFYAGAILQPSITSVTPAVWDFSSATSKITGDLKIIVDTSFWSPFILDISGDSVVDFQCCEIIDSEKNGLLNIVTNLNSSNVRLNVKNCDCVVEVVQGNVQLECDYLYKFTNLGIGSDIVAEIKLIEQLQIFGGRVDLSILEINQTNNSVQMNGGVLYIRGAYFLSNLNNLIIEAGQAYLLNCRLKSTTGGFANIRFLGDGPEVFLDNCVLVMTPDAITDYTVTALNLGFLNAYNGVMANYPHLAPEVEIPFGAMTVNPLVSFP